jgi:hypothetical protein
VSSVAVLGYIGPKRPYTASLSPKNAPFLDGVLKERGMTVEEFQLLREKKTEKPAAFHAANAVQPPSPGEGSILQNSISARRFSDTFWDYFSAQKQK